MNNPNLSGGATTEQKVKEKNQYRITVEPDAFPSILETVILSTLNLEQKVAELFSAVYEDFSGCSITPYPDGKGFDVRLYFTSNHVGGEDNSKAFELIDFSPENGIKSKLQMLAQVQKKRLFSITDFGKGGLADFIEQRFKTKDGKIKWDQLTTEREQPNGISRTTYVEVGGIDIKNILATIYGWKNPLVKHDSFQYDISVRRPLGAGAGSINWLVDITRISRAELTKLETASGFAVHTNGIRMTSNIR